MNLFKRQFRRNAVVTVLLMLLLTVAVAFCSIGFAAWVMTRNQITDMKSQYTTVAIPVSEDGCIYNDSILYAEGTRMFLKEQKKHDYPGVLAEDVRGFLTAHVAGCESVSPYEKDYFSSYLFDEYNISMMVLAVRCTSVLDLTDPESIGIRAVWDDKGNITGYEEVCQKIYMAEFELEESVCRFAGYAAIPENVVIHIVSQLHTEDGQIPFKQGKTYLLFGINQGIVVGSGDVIDVVEVDGEILPITEEILIQSIAADVIFTEGRTDSIYINSNYFFSWQEKKDAEGYRYDTLKENSLPFYAEYTGDWREFLESEEGKVWQEEIIPWCQLNYESVSVILTDNIDSLLLFSNGSADMLEGRKFEKEEYIGGDAVCMVSAAYAAKNNLSVGDTINLEFHQSDMNYQMKCGYANFEDWEYTYEPIWVQEPCTEENRIGVEKDYTIIGIYTAPEFSTGWHNFQADTIFVPKASMPDALQYEQGNKVLMYSVILENGMQEEFEEYISEMGYGGDFIYSDQGYQEALESFETLSANAFRMAVSGGGVFLLAAVLFLFLNFRRVSPVIRSMRLLGVRGKLVWRDLTAALAIVIVVSAAIGAGLGYLLYGTVTVQILEQSTAAQPQVMILCAVVQAAVLVLAAAVVSALAVNRKMMAGKHRRRK